MATNQDAQTLEETLDKTDLGHIINENRKLILTLSFIVIIGIVAYSIQGHLSNEKKLVQLDKAFEVENTIFTPFISDKTKGEDFIKELEKVEMDLVGNPNLVPVLIEAINKLDEQNLVNEKVISLAQKWQKHLSKSHYLNLFLSVRLAGLYEDANKLDEAIATLENLIAFKSNIMKEKIYFDLGRLYLKKGDKQKAQERFDYILKNEKLNNSEYAKLIKLYLGEL